ncbi:hypothetical protein ACP275_01G121700 [Erythranthe tilingii]
MTEDSFKSIKYGENVLLYTFEPLLVIFIFIAKSKKLYRGFLRLVHIVPNLDKEFYDISRNSNLFTSTRPTVTEILRESRSRKGSFPITDSNPLSNCTLQKLEDPHGFKYCTIALGKLPPNFLV